MLEVKVVGWIKGEENMSATCVKVMFKGHIDKNKCTAKGGIHDEK